MRARDVLDRILLAAVWGASFLRVVSISALAAPAVGPGVVAACRVGGAALLLLPLVLARGELPQWRPLLPALAVSGVLCCVMAADKVFARVPGFDCSCGWLAGERLALESHQTMTCYGATAS